MDPIDLAFRATSVTRDRCRLTVRESKSASVPFTADSSGLGLGDDRSMSHAREQYRHFDGWVFVAVRAIAQRMAGQTIRVARAKQLRRGAKEYVSLACKGIVDGDLVPLQQHALLESLGDPNPLMVAWSLGFVTAASLELTGRAIWWIVADGPKRQIWPIPVDWAQPDHRRGFYSGWKITWPGSTQRITVPGDEVVHFSYPSPSGLLDVISPLQTQARAVTADESIQTAQHRAFANGLFPGLAIIAGDPNDMDKRPVLEKPQRQQIITAIRKSFGGVMRAGEPIILDALIRDIKQITNKPNEMDFLHSGAATKARIFQAFGVNPLICGEIEGANRAQAVVAEESFCSNVINPKLELLSQCMTAWLGPMFAQGGERLIVWIEPCRPADPDKTRQDYDLGLRYGATTRNEYRQNVLGLGPMPGGDVPLIPASLMPEEPLQQEPDVEPAESY